MDLRKLSVQELLQRCLESNDEAAWSEFVRRFQPMIAGVVAKSIRHWARPTPELVDDLVHDTYLKLFANNRRALREFDCQHDLALFGFIKKVASNVVHDRFRVDRNQKHGGPFEDEELDSPSFAMCAVTPPDNMDRHVLRGEIEDSLHSLASEENFARDYTIFCLYYRFGFTAKAISRFQGINLTVKGVESVLLRLIRWLRDHLDKAS
jgi:RNA polymerase sigma-70 factor (ECF subfamily)